MLSGRFDYEMKPCVSPLGPVKLFEFFPYKIIASMTNKAQSAFSGGFSLFLAMLGKLKGDGKSKDFNLGLLYLLCF